jgi:hypothetical protein
LQYLAVALFQTPQTALGSGVCFPLIIPAARGFVKEGVATASTVATVRRGDKKTPNREVRRLKRVKRRSTVKI